MKKKIPRELSAHTFGLNTCIWTLFSNIFFSETAWPIKAKFHVEPPWEGGKKFYINGSGHMTKMIAMPIYGKNIKKIFSYRFNCPMFIKLGMGHYVLKLYTVYINDDSVLTLTHFNTMSNLTKLVFVHKVGPNIR